MASWYHYLPTKRCMLASIRGREADAMTIATQLTPLGESDLMQFHDIRVSREFFFSIGQELDSGKYYVSFPVSNGLIDY